MNANVDYSHGTAPIIDVALALDNVGAGYRIVELADRSFRFVWGNVRARVGDRIPADACRFQTEERGAELADNYDDAVGRWNAHAMGLSTAGDYRVAAEMLRTSETPLPECIAENLV
jgi:hypothetical protein